MPDPTSPPPRYAPPSRGITGADIDLAADALLRQGERPTIEKIRAKIGRGSPNTINPLLDAWWKRLASRLDAGPAALHRLPEPVAHAAETLWMQALDESRRRAVLELRSAERASAADRQALQVRSHVLSLREGELESRLKDRERTQAALESQMRELTLLLRKAEATRGALLERIADLEKQLLAPAPRRALRRGAVPGPSRRTKTGTVRKKPRRQKTSSTLQRPKKRAKRRQ